MVTLGALFGDCDRQYPVSMVRDTFTRNGDIALFNQGTASLQPDQCIPAGFFRYNLLEG